MIHNKRRHEWKSGIKPIFYCPSHKVGNIYYPFPEERVFRCTIEGCPCVVGCGWIATCEICGKVIHNCIHGCKKGIPISTSKRNLLLIKIDQMIDHYNLNHRKMPVFLYGRLDDVEYNG